MRLSPAHLFSENVFFFFFFFFFFASVRKSTHPPCVRSPFRKTSPPRRRVLESSNASTSRHAAKQNSADVFETSRAFTFHRLKKWILSKRLKRARIRSYFKDLSRRPFSNRFPIKTFRERITRESPLFGAVVRSSSRGRDVVVFVRVRFFITESRPREASASAAHEDVYEEDEFWIQKLFAVADKIIVVVVVFEKKKRLLHPSFHPRASVRDEQQE